MMIRQTRTNAAMLCIALIFLLQNGAIAQLPQYAWANTLRGLSSPFSLTNSSNTNDIALDADGNIYTIGDFYGSIDANSGAGTTTLSAEESGVRTFVIKTSPAGTLIWAKALQGEGTANPSSLAVDNSGNVYITGRFTETVDFDPGSGTFNLTASSNFDMFFAKLDVSGNFVWAKKIFTSNFISPHKLQVDPQGNPVCVGYFSGTGDFNPNTGTASLTGASNSFILKLDASGNFVFVKQFTATSVNAVEDFIIANDGTMLLGGYFSSTTDFDPDAGVFNLGVSSFSQDAFFCKLSAQGALLWVQKIGGANSDKINALDTDSEGNILITGTFRNAVDFDPGPGSFLMQTSSSTLDDIFIAKYSATGDFIWARQIGNEDGNFTDENTNDLAVDPSGNVVVVGFYYDEIDFDPGAGSFPLYTGLFRNTFVLSLNQLGAFNYAFDIGMNEDVAGSESNAIRIDPSGNIYIGGYTDGICDMNPGNGTNNITSDFDQGMLWKLGPPSSNAYFTLPDYTECTGNVIQLVSNNSSLQTTWQWSANGGIITNANASNASIVFNQTGTFTIELTVTSTSGTSTSSQVVVIGNGPSLSLTSTAQVLCGGGSANITASFSGGNIAWNTGQTSNSIFVSPTTTTTYIATVTANNGCTAVASQTIEVVSQLNVVITANDVVICSGESVTLTASGANFYSWSNGSSGSSIVVSPGSNTTYTVTGFVGACEGSDSQAIQVSAAPNVSIQSTGNTVCSGASVTLTANGASTYQWSTGQSGNSITVSPSTSTTYTVTGSNAAGCTATASRTINVGTNPTLSLNSTNNTICAGNTVSITATGANTYVWSGGQTGATISVSPQNTSSYTVTGTNVQGCQSSSSITINVNPNPVLSIQSTSNSICAGLSVSLSAEGANTYSWSNGQNGNSINVSPSTTTTYSVTGQNSFGCQSTASQQITVLPLPNVSIQSPTTSVCVGNVLTLTGAGAINYVWSTGENASSIQVNPQTNLSISVTGTNLTGCSNSANIEITVQEPPVLSFDEPPIGFCVNSTAYQMEVLPAGGTFSGNGVNGSSFTPSLAGVGQHEITYIYSNGVCTADTSFMLNVEECVSSAENPVQPNIELFPNPTNGIVFIKNVPPGSSIAIFNASGQNLEQRISNTSILELNLSHLPAGVYLVQIGNDTYQSTQKLLKQ